MKQITRDNLIYLAVGLGVAALVVIDFFCAEGHGREMWWPSKFAFRAVTTPGLLAYFVAREMRRKEATLIQTLGASLLATLLQVGVMFSSRQLVERLHGISYSALTVFEIYLVWLATTRVALYAFRTGRRRSSVN